MQVAARTAQVAVSSSRSSRACSRARLCVRASAWTKVSTVKEVEAAGKLVVEVGGERILLAAVDGEVFAVSNKCSHLSLPLVGKTPVFQAKVCLWGTFVGHSVF